MIVQGAQLQFSAQHASLTSRRESLEIEHFPARPQRSEAPPASDRARERAAEPSAVHGRRDASDDEQGLSAELKLLKTIIERLTGKLMELFNAGDLLAEPAPSNTPPPAPATDSNPTGAGGMRVTATSEYAEHESLRFAASGTINTADGRTIDFTVELNMDRSLVRRESLSMEFGDVPKLKDPLVINYGGGAAELTRDRYAFDIDADGLADQIPGLAPGRALLVLDRNGNGKLDGANEVIGAPTGQAFAELGQLDDDGNGFVDAGDAAWQNLRLWRPGQDPEQLTALSDKGIGALSTDSLQTSFALHDADNAQAGQLRRSSIFIGEDGRVGTTQQIDFMV